MAKALWKIAAEQYECETCNAAPYEPCRSMRNKKVALPHNDRCLKARADGWKIFERDEEGESLR